MAGKLTPEMEARKWKPGQSGNPNKIYKRKPLYDALSKMLTPERSEAVVVAILREALSGNVRAAQFLRDTFEGKPITQVEMSQTTETVSEFMERIINGLEDQSTAAGTTVERSKRVQSRVSKKAKVLGKTDASVRSTAKRRKNNSNPVG